MLLRPDDIAAVVQRLRATEGMLPSPPRRRRLDFSLWPAGLPQSGLSNFFGLPGGGKTEAALRFAREMAHPPGARHAGARHAVPLPGFVAWLEPSLTAYPPAFAGLGLDLSHFLFIETKQRLVWSALQILRSQCFALALLACESQEFEEADLRRLQLESERNGVPALLISEKPLASWCVRLRLEVKREGGTLRLREADRAAKVVGEGV